jgi:hypothetical protein
VSHVVKASVSEDAEAILSNMLKLMQRTFSSLNGAFEAYLCHSGNDLLKCFIGHIA